MSTQRTIKFRAWHSREEEMTAWDIIFDDGILPYFRDEAFILMQYTGLKDKEGRDIYEGDVVLLPGNPDPAAGDPTAMCVVEYSGPHLVYRDVDHLNRKEMIHGILGWDVNEDEDAEVIGNIYENPELLNQ